MGILGSLLDAIFGAASVVERDMNRKADDFGSGYDRGSARASRMSDDELRASLKRAKENGVSDWKSAGQA